MPTLGFDIWSGARTELESSSFCGMGHEVIVSKSQNLMFYSRGKVKLRILEDLLEPNITTNSTPERVLYVSVIKAAAGLSHHTVFKLAVELYILSQNETIIS